MSWLLQETLSYKFVLKPDKVRKKKPGALFSKIRTWFAFRVLQCYTFIVLKKPENKLSTLAKKTSGLLSKFSPLWNKSIKLGFSQRFLRLVNGHSNWILNHNLKLKTERNIFKVHELWLWLFYNFFCARRFTKAIQNNLLFPAKSCPLPLHTKLFPLHICDIVKSFCLIYMISFAVFRVVFRIISNIYDRKNIEIVFEISSKMLLKYNILII